MDITVSSRGANLTASLRATTEKKLAKLTRLADGIERAEVHYSEEANPRIRDRERCEITLDGHGRHLRTHAEAGDVLTALEQAVHKVERQLRKSKTKWLRRHNEGRRHSG